MIIFFQLVTLIHWNPTQRRGRGERPGALVESNAPQIIAVCCLECAVCRQQLLFSRDEMKSDMQ